MSHAGLRSRRPADSLRAFAWGWMALLAACSSSPADNNTDRPPISTDRPPISVPQASPALVSAPTPLSDGAPPSESRSAGSSGLAYVSMPPGTDSAGIAAVISSKRVGVPVQVVMTAGGFDPIGIEAAPGDTLVIRVLHADGSDAPGYAEVPPASLLRVVRTLPPRRKTDVPLNAVVQAIFSEPIDSTSLIGAIHLRRGGVEVPGAVEAVVSGGTVLSGLFRPSQPLAPATEYEYEITTGVASLTGGTLSAPVTTTFTTGGALAPVLWIDPVTDLQSGVVGQRLAKPIRVTALVSSGPKVGLQIVWRTVQGGHVEPATSITDSTGTASAEWVLDIHGGWQGAVASIRGVADSAMFHATGLSGAPVRLDPSGDNQVVAVNHPGFRLELRTVDQYGNAASDVPVNWSVVEGPLRRLDTGLDAVALFAPDGAQGTAVIRASAMGQSFQYAITVGPPELFVALDGSWRGYAFRSLANGSRPAVDTIPAGTTVTWMLQYMYLADDFHHIHEAEGPPFAGANFIRRGSRSDGYTAKISFPTPGVYHYADDYGSGLLGTLVVR